MKASTRRRLEPIEDSLSRRKAPTRDQLSQLRAEELRHKADHLAGQARPTGQGHLVTQRVTGIAPDELRGLAADTLRRVQPGPAVVILGAEHKGKALLAAAVSSDLHQGGTQASRILTDAARTVGGGSGGLGPIASAGGRRTEALVQALNTAAAEASHLLTHR